MFGTGEDLESARKNVDALTARALLVMIGMVMIGSPPAPEAKEEVNVILLEIATRHEEMSRLSEAAAKCPRASVARMRAEDRAAL